MFRESKRVVLSTVIQSWNAITLKPRLKQKSARLIIVSFDMKPSTRPLFDQFVQRQTGEYLKVWIVRTLVFPILLCKPLATACPTETGSLLSFCLFEVLQKLKLVKVKVWLVAKQSRGYLIFQIDATLKAANVEIPYQQLDQHAYHTLVRYLRD